MESMMTIAVCTKKSNPSLAFTVAPTTVASGRGLLAQPGRQPLTDADIHQRIAARLKAQDIATQFAEERNDAD
ncbi:MAG: hypothetical protein QG599_2692 [Pseudomonadota bacterium]|nr:hypothetical protein [Pseudomonadota bacterium]